jgi:hypothetical protein
MQLAGLLVLVFCYKFRKKEEEILENLSEINELIEKYLHIRSDLKRFKRRAAWKIFIQWMIVLGSGIFCHIFKDIIYLHKNDHLPMPEVAAAVCCVYSMKYIFYVDLLHFQMKVKKIF